MRTLFKVETEFLKMTDKMKQVSYIQKRAFHALAFAALVAPLKAQTVRIKRRRGFVYQTID
jgi:hypothetical protein